MSRPQPAEAVKLLASLFGGEGGLIEAAIRDLAERYGRVDYLSAPLDFAYTDYYEREFGGGLFRRLVAFERLVAPDMLPDVKLWTNGLEKRLAAGGKRCVNIDPGYLARPHLILATGKGYTHRPYLRDGIYADLTLVFRQGAFHPLPWTYPDYAGEMMIAILTRIREKYILQLKGKSGGGMATAGADPAGLAGDKEQP
ncbi:MAG: DUF4416 family protein [Syntrophaceae bacterium]|nr:DUF4416 family protein [Syntrophaceae bacterium]